jgi:3-isopropylmalate dehydrogenase
MMKKKIAKVLLLPGDGVGPEIMNQAEKILDVLSNGFIEIERETDVIGGASIEMNGEPITEHVINKAKTSDVVLLGAVGGEQWDLPANHLRPEQGLLRLRRTLNLFANLRPVKIYAGLTSASPLKKELVNGADFVIVRELTGGIYYGKPRGIRNTSKGEKALNTEVYYRYEIERIARIAFEIATARKKKVTSVDKANVLESSMLWRDVVNRIHREYSNVTLSHLYVDNCAMQIIKNPRQFDVILTNNMFGDILSDEAAMISGSIGMLASASLGGSTGLYEPIHGSAPDIAGQNKANPCAAILSIALMCEYSLRNQKISKAIENAVENVLKQGYRTVDIAETSSEILTTSEMGDKIKNELEKTITTDY